MSKNRRTTNGNQRSNIVQANCHLPMTAVGIELLGSVNMRVGQWDGISGHTITRQCQHEGGIGRVGQWGWDNGSFELENKTGSHGWVLATTDKIILAEGSGPTDGHPASLSSYGAELGGLIAVLYTIYHICQHHDVTSGAKSSITATTKGSSKMFFTRNPLRSHNIYRWITIWSTSHNTY